eukprot:gnl/MRDRNA2_/MRDRNA2_158536_c0_seq1.p1 gnl/MRDRNA2_/MRDRNA2_158536_c0~~gnl/MRDRNA2_/MRDRNA2_158536_c0_seq1.p1  ORF type:complete len:248 (+),score=31.90 gnl/MRDRNA2_/MRDRNA2_158536_c0_seq1:105-848(+)
MAPCCSHGVVMVFPYLLSLSSEETKRTIQMDESAKAHLNPIIPGAMINQSDLSIASRTYLWETWTNKTLFYSGKGVQCTLTTKAVKQGFHASHNKRTLTVKLEADSYKPFEFKLEDKWKTTPGAVYQDLQPKDFIMHWDFLFRMTQKVILSDPDSTSLSSDYYIPQTAQLNEADFEDKVCPNLQVRKMTIPFEDWTDEPKGKRPFYTEGMIFFKYRCKPTSEELEVLKAGVYLYHLGQMFQGRSAIK